MTELVRFSAQGHPALRATHGKTLEFTADSTVTARATCVLGVTAALPTAAIAGPIRITMTVGTDAISLDAVGNSAWRPGRSAVVRRSPLRRPDTFATDATLAAADLPRDFAAALADPATRLEVAVSARPSVPWLVRFRLSPSNEGRLVAEAAAADVIRAEDTEARARLSELGIALTGAADSGRVLSVSSGPAGRLPLPAADEVIGWPAEFAVLAAQPDAAPVVFVPPGAEVAVLAAANPQAAVVFRGPAERLNRTVATIGRPAADVVLVALSDPERPWRGGQSELDGPDRGELICLVGAQPGPASAAPVDPAAFVTGLLSAGVSSRTVALALAGLPGWSRRAAYDFVLARQGPTT